MERLEKKIVLVSGGAGGIGSAIARRMAAEGASVLVTDILLDGAERVAAELGNQILRLPVRCL